MAPAGTVTQNPTQGSVIQSGSCLELGGIGPTISQAIASTDRA